MASYELWIANDRGTPIGPLEPIEFEYSRVLGAPGWFVGTFEYDQRVIDRMGRDYQVSIRRSGRGEPMRLYNTYLVRNWSATDFVNHDKRVKIQGPDYRDILARRINAYAVDNANSLITDNADDMMKSVVDNNLGSSAGTGRDLSSQGFSIQASTAQGPSITFAMGWKNVLATLQQISQASAVAGSTVYFDLVMTPSGVIGGSPSFEFQTYVGIPGKDLRFSTTGNLAFSKELGNLSFAHFEEDTSAEFNYVYAGGQGSGASRTIVELGDDDRINSSIFNRRELFVNGSASSTTAGVTSAAQKRLNEKRPRSMLVADLLDTDDTQFHVDWNVGDMVTVYAFGRSYDEIIRSVNVRVDSQGKESISARFEHGSLMGEPLQRIITEFKDMSARIDALEAEDKV